MEENLCAATKSVDELVIASLPEEAKKLVCVEFPGIVENEDRAIACLGGNSSISKAYFDKHGRLEVRFRPDDQYCKPAVARSNKTSCLVLKVKKKRRLKEKMETKGVGEKMETDSGETVEKEKEKEGGSPSSRESNKEVEYDYSAELLGVVNTIFQFPGMTDYQVLPPGLNTMSHKGGLVEPKDFQIKEPVDEFYTDRDLPSFLPPEGFSRFDKPTSFVFTKGVKSGARTDDPNRMGPRRVGNTYGLTFDFKGSIPTQPPHADVLNSQFASHPKIPLLKKLYEERPLWSRLALQWRLKLPETVVRQLLAIVAYKFTSGPFKKMWVKFGYDPRTDPSSKIYQCLDIRVPQEVTTVHRSKMYASRSRRTFPTESTVGELFGSKDESTSEASAIPIEDTMFIYYPDRLPSQRQLHYQLCDIMDDKLQELIHSNDGKEQECTEINGWCEKNTYDKLRKAMTIAFRKLAAGTAEQKVKHE